MYILCSLYVQLQLTATAFPVTTAVGYGNWYSK